MIAAGHWGAPARLGPRPLVLHLAQARFAQCGGGRADAHVLEDFVRGLQAYWRHPYRRSGDQPPVVWTQGAARLFDYGPKRGFPALVVPSLVNRAYVLDLMPERSLLRHLSRHGIRPFLLDWGEPGPAERRLTLDDHIRTRLCGALSHVRTVCAVPPALIGYCMGGLLTLALATLQPHAVAGIALLAVPWDFHAGGPNPNALDELVARPMTRLAGGLGGLPVDLIQSLFASVEPQNVVRKFARFARLDPHSPDARAFVAIEDWLNDGVPLGAEVARTCLLDWYVENRPARGLWPIGGRPVRPQALEVPALVAIPARDRIVPPASAAALAAALPRAQVLRPSAGHVGMVVGARAKERLWQPLADWLTAVAAMQK